MTRQPLLGNGTAWAALVLGLPNAAISAYWGLGGTWLLDTVGGALESKGRAGSPGLIAIVWLSVILKLIASVIGLAAFRAPELRPVQVVRFIGWSAGAILFAYGLILSSVGIMIETGIISTAAEADRHALRWHAFFWDPWFFIWGACLLLAMRESGRTLMFPRGDGSPV